MDDILTLEDLNQLSDMSRPAYYDADEQLREVNTSEMYQIAK